LAAHKRQAIRNALITAADKAMYAAKILGRDRCEIAGEQKTAVDERAHALSPPASSSIVS
jgi:hypothetical protein